MYHTTAHMTEGAPTNQTEVCFNRCGNSHGKSSDHGPAGDATAILHVLLLHMLFTKVDNILNITVPSEGPIRNFNVKVILDGHDYFHDI